MQKANKGGKIKAIHREERTNPAPNAINTSGTGIASFVFFEPHLGHETI